MKRKVITRFAVVGVALLLTGAVAVSTADKLLIEPLTVDSLGGLAEKYIEFREFYGPIVPPGAMYEDVADLMSKGDWSFLKEDWFFTFDDGVLYVPEKSELAKGLKLPVRIQAREDIKTGEIYLFSAPLTDGKAGEFAGLAAFKAPDFMPYEKDFPLDRYLSDEFAPRRVVWEITLKPEADAWADLISQRDEAPVSKLLEGGGMMAMMSVPEEHTNDIWIGGAPNGDGLNVMVYTPPGVSNIEIYVCSDLLSNVWTVAAKDLSSAGTNEVIWFTETDEIGFFRAGNMDIDSDGDGINDAREKIVHKTDPNDSDSDDDEMPDGWEVLHTLNPHVNDAFCDPDGDHIPSLYEYMNGTTDPTNALSLPSPIATVSTNGHDGTYTNIQTAVNDAAASNAYPIVLIESGIYTGTGNRDIELNVPDILIYGTNAATVIDCQTNGRAFYIQSGKPVISGLVMQNGYKPYDYGAALYADYWGDVDLRLVNCAISQNYGWSAIYCGGNAVLDSCTIANNEIYQHSSAYAIYGSSSMQIKNCLIWDNGGVEQIYPSDIQVSYSCVEGWNENGGNTTNDPFLVYNSWRIATTNSSCIGKGTLTNAPGSDIDGEVRGANVEMGADEFIDTDGDGLPDWWETFTGATDAAADVDNMPDGLSNLQEYRSGTDPWLGDTDGDGLSDYEESEFYNTNWSGSNPLDPDTDDDLMLDGYEVNHGFDPQDDKDAYYDPDGDHIPNLYEYIYETDPANALFVPTNTAVVSINGHDGTYTNIQAAVNDAAASNVYPIIRIEPGIYTGTGNRDITLSMTNILIYGTNAQTVIDCQTNGRAFYIISGRPVISGLVMRNGYMPYDSGGAVYVTDGKPRLINCVFWNNQAHSGGALKDYSGAILEGCTLVSNYADHDGGAVDGWSTTLRNCLVWNNRAPNYPQLRINSAGSVFYSCVEGWNEDNGNTTNDPVLVYNSWRIAATNSSCIGSGNITNAPLMDVDGTVRGVLVDIGADEFIDTDGDGLPDWWETHYGVSDPDADEDSDNLTNLQECLSGTDPWDSDSDDDGLSDYEESSVYNPMNWTGTSPLDADSDDDLMLDGYEFNHGLNPSDGQDAYYDPDGDRIPNLYEYMNGATDPTNALSLPSPAATVSTNGHDSTYTNIQTAVSNAAASHVYPIVLIESGTYTGEGNRNIEFDVADILIYGTNAQTVIDCEQSGHAFFITSGRPVISGLVMQNGYKQYNSGGAIYALGGAPRLINCVFWNNHAWMDGGALYTGNAVLENCTLVGNHAESLGGAVYGNAVLRNCLVWNNSAFSGYPQIRYASVNYSCVQGGYDGTGNTTNDPDLVAGSWRIATTNSSCMGAGNKTNAPGLDIDGEVRGADVDLGADEFIDTDGDGLPDWWEVLHGIGDPDDDEDEDGLTNLQECLSGTDPWDSDSDNDGLSDYEESGLYNANWTGTDPLNPDTDGDLMPDGYEKNHGLNPSDGQDAFFDPDGDRIPNLYEYIYETIPTNALSFPTPTVVVSTNGHGSTYTNIQTAVNDAAASNAYPIVLIEAGMYTGAGNRDITLNVTSILIYGTNAQTVIDCQTNGRAFYITAGHPVISGLVMRNGYIPYDSGGAIYCSDGTPRLINCVFWNNRADYGGGAIMDYSGAVLEGCTLVNNYAGGNGGAVCGAATLRNCLVWNNSAFSVPQIAYASVSYSCVEGGYSGTGNITNNPDLVSGSWRIASTNSSCWRAGTSSNAPVIDIDGEARAGGIDIGADQAVDTDGDGLTDWFELNRVPPTDPADPDSDNDGLNDGEEIYTHHTDPLDSDSDDDGLEDGDEIAHQTNPLNPDTDGDGLNDGDEVHQYGTDPLLTDSDDDGLSDYDEVIVYGSNPSVHDSMLDSDDDGILDILDSSPANAALPVQGTCVITVGYPLEDQILN